MTKNATLIVRAIVARGELSPTQSAASSSFRIRLQSRGLGTPSLSAAEREALVEYLGSP